MKKKFIQNANSQKRAKNFFDVVSSDDTLQVIVGQDSSNQILLLWQDEYYLNEYLSTSSITIKLSKPCTMDFLKWLKGNTHKRFLIHPVFEQESLELDSEDVFKRIVANIDSDGDFYNILKEHKMI